MCWIIHWLNAALGSDFAANKLSMCCARVGGVAALTAARQVARQTASRSNMVASVFTEEIDGRVGEPNLLWGAARQRLGELAYLD